MIIAILNRRNAAYIISLSALALGACAHGNDFPSLARRPIERITGTANVAATDTMPAAIAAAAAPDLLGKLSAIETSTLQADSQFRNKASAAETSIAAALPAPVASNTWAKAISALSVLESARTETAKGLIALDQIEIEYRLTHLGGNQLGQAAPSILAMRAKIAAIIADEDAQLLPLRAKLAM